jgi:hypothetical protein
MTDPDFRALCAELVAALDPKVVGMEGYGPIAALLPRARAVLAQTELQELSDLRARIEILEAALHRHIMQTSSGMAASKVLDLSDLPQLTPEQVQNLQDLLGTYRSQALADRVRAAELDGTNHTREED